MKEEYKVVRRFECYGKTMVAVQMNGSSVNTMTIEEWERFGVEAIMRAVRK